MYSFTSRWMLTLAVLLTIVGGLSGTAQAPAPSRWLWQPRSGTLDAVPAGPQRPVPFVRRSRVVRVTLDRLQDDRLRLELFDGRSIEVHRVRTENHRDGSTVWLGRVHADPLSAVALARHGAIVQGSIRTAAGSYSIEPLGAGPDHLVQELVMDAVGAELPPLVPPSLPPAAGPSALDAIDDGGTVDVLVFYTRAARQQAGGTDEAVRARIALGVAEANQAYVNSGVSPRLRLVGSELIGYRETGDLADDLRHLTIEGDGSMDIAHARRNAVAADLVKLVVGSPAGGACGVAWVMQHLSLSFAPYAFSVTAYPCISPNYTFAHELAHNMGSVHAPDDPNAPPVFPYSYGYKDPQQRFRTVMAYDCASGCPRVLHFSNPDVEYVQAPTGTTAHHNVLSLNQTAPTVTNFRASRPATPLLDAPRDLTVTTVGTAVTVAWAAPAAGAPRNYVVEVGTDEGLANVATFVLDGSTMSLVREAVPAGRYFVQVRAFDAFGPGPPSTAEQLVMTAAGRCVVPASAPALLPPVVAGATVTLSWTSVTSPTAVLGYTVAAATRPNGPSIAVLETGDSSPTFTTTAAPGLYFVRVAASNACGLGAASDEVAVMVGAPVPGPPVGVRWTVGADRLVTFTWEPSPVGGTPLRYIVEAGSAPDLTNLAALTTADATPALAVHAPPGAYYVRLRAVNQHGTSAPSEEIVLRVP